MMNLFVKNGLVSFTTHFGTLLCLLCVAQIACNNAQQNLSTSLTVRAEPPCPLNCTCGWNPSTTSLSIRCPGRTADPNDLLIEIDKYLEDKEYEKLTNLEITHSILNEIPSTICMLKNLKMINLNDNQILKLPDHCLTELYDLKSFNVERNNLTYLQEGLFDGLQKLYKVSFEQNQIREIGLRLFSNYSDLISLSDINLKGNSLTSLELWPFVRGQVLNGATVSLDDNRISNFTNELNWFFNCSSPKFHMNFMLRKNKFKHITDFLSAFDLTTEEDLFCLYGSDPYSEMFIDIDGSDYICDCLDFTIYSMVAFAPAIISILDRTI